MNATLSQMKRCFFTTIVVLSTIITSWAFAPSNINAAQTVQDVVVVNTKDVNVRSLPNTNGKKLGKVQTGTMLGRYENRSDGWSCVDYAGTVAYIKTEFLDLYLAGTSAELGSIASAPAKATTAINKQNGVNSSQANSSTNIGTTVYVSRTGSKYHKNPNCSGMKNPTPMSLEEAKLTRTACKNCCR